MKTLKFRANYNSRATEIRGRHCKVYLEQVKGGMNQLVIACVRGCFCATDEGAPYLAFCWPDMGRD